MGTDSAFQIPAHDITGVDSFELAPVSVVSLRLPRFIFPHFTTVGEMEGLTSSLLTSFIVC